MKLILSYKKPLFENDKIVGFEVFSKYTINSSKLKNGGDIFDNLDSLIVKKKLSSASTSTSIIEKNNKKGVVKNITNIELDNNLTIFNIKELIYNLLNINIENQHIEQFIESENKYKNIEYKYENKSLMITKDTTLNNILNYEYEKINEIFIDLDIINNRNLYIIKEFTKIKQLKDLDFEKYIKIDVFDLNDFILDKDKLYKQIIQDDEILNNIYTGFIEKFFPMYDLNLFKNYMQSINKLDIYPNLFIEKNRIIEKIDIINKINKNSIAKNEKKTNINLVNLKIESYNNNKSIDIQEIFNAIELKKFDNIEKIECRLNINDKILYLEKINVFDIDINVKKHLYLYKFNELSVKNDLILFSIIINNRKYKIINTMINIILDEYNNLYLSISLNDNISLEDYKTIIQLEVNKVITDLNKKLKFNINLINKFNINLLSLDSSIIYNKSLNNDQHLELLNNIKKYEILEYYKVINIDETNNKIELKLTYLDFDTLINENKLNEYTNNYYIYKLDPFLLEKYNKIIYTAKIIIQPRINDIKLDFININVNEYEYINIFLLKIIKSCLIKTVNKKIKLSNSFNKIKLLKESDPNLYIINKSDSKNLYSRKCQSSQQPIIVNEKEIKSKKIKNYIKYWNFTKNKTEFYSCDNKKFPYVKFLTNIHPKNYCIPCCKKKSMDAIKIKSSYEEIHNKCLSKFQYSKNERTQKDSEIKSRYIMNYSCKIMLENDRLMDLPLTLKKIFNNIYEIDDKIDNETNNFYIKGINQNFMNVKNVGMLFILSSVLNSNLDETILLINNFLLDNPNLINIILGGKLLNYISNTKDLVKLINNTFSNKFNFKSLNLEFNDWNSFFIDISKYFGIVYIIIDEFDNEVLNDSILKIKLSDNIKNASDYILNTKNYNYVIIVNRTIDNNSIYYPIFKLNYKEFYRSHSIYKKKYEYSESIIVKIKNIVKNTLLKTNKKNLTIELELINKFILDSNKYKIIKYFLNKNNEIYSILIQINKTQNYLYLNVDNSKIDNMTYKEILNSSLYDYNYINLNKYKIELSHILKFITEINEFVYNINKILYSDNFYKQYINNIVISNNNSSNNYKILNLFEEQLYNIENFQHNYLRINNYILHNDKIIGITCNNIDCYISEKITIENGIKLINIQYNNINNILNSKSIKKKDFSIIFNRIFSLENNINISKLFIPEYKNISNFDMYKNYFKLYLYNPNKINTIITSKEIIKDDRIQKLNESLYNTNLYNLLILHIVNLILKMKNMNLRNKLKFSISNFENNDLDAILINNKNDKIFKIIDDYTNIVYKGNEVDSNISTQIINNYFILFLKNIIRLNKGQNLAQIKKILLDTFDKTKFDFDKIYIYNILNLNKKDLIDKIDNLLEGHIIDKHTNTKYNLINFNICDNTKKSYYCENNKLIISKKIYKNMLDIIYYDLTNPFKQKLLLNFTNINNKLYKFNSYINEKIYIYY
jgi:hypothetical protein